MTLKTKLASPKSLFRVRGLFVVGGALVTLSLYLVFFFDMHLRQFCEAIGSNANSAAVNIGSVKTHLLAGTIELKGIQIADASEPMQNLLEIDRVEMRMAWGPILRRKILIEDMTIDGIRHATARTVSGIDTDAANKANPGLMARAASTMYSDIRREIGDNPFRHIGQLLGGLNLTGRVEMSLKELESKQKAEALEAELLARLRGFRSQTAELKPIRSLSSLTARLAEINKENLPAAEKLTRIQAVRAELIEERRVVTEVNEGLAKEMEGFTAKMAGVETSIKNDVSRLRNQLKLPKLDAEDLTSGMLGPQLIGQLERVSYWVDLARRKMPTGYRGGQINVVARENDRGVTVNFGKMAAYPAFLLRRVTLKSKPDGRPGVGTVNGSISGLTSDPPIYGYPMNIILTADFPDRGVEKITVKAQIDHTQEQSKENIEFSAAKLPLRSFPVNDAGDLSLKLTKGHAGFAGHVQFEEDKLEGSARILFRDVSYTVNSRFKKIEETVRSAVQPLDTIDLATSVQGNFDGLKFQARSNLGTRLAQAIQGEFRHQILAVEDDLRKYILDQIYPVMERSEQHMRDLREAGPLPLDARLRALQENMTHADKEIARLDGSASNASRKTKARRPAAAAKN